MNFYSQVDSFKHYGQEGAIEAYPLDCVVNSELAEGTLSCMGAGYTPKGAYLISSQFSLNKEGERKLENDELSN